MDQIVQSPSFPIVGIGASAGGLEPLEDLFRRVPAAPGMAFVVIQHLSPEHQGLLAQILARCTAMPVHQITDGLSIEADAVYVMVPGFTLALRDGRLRLGEPSGKRGHRPPLDDFLRSLARERGERAIAIILSGTGTNGTAGAQAIKAAGGICLAQNPESAAFPGMPQSLIHAGYADQVLEPRDMPDAFIRYFANPQVDPRIARGPAEDGPDGDPAALDELLGLLRARTRHDFTGYRKSTLLRRIQRRMGLVGVTRLSDYAEMLPGRVEEIAALAGDLMINVSGFFRDPQAWDALRTSVIDPLCDSKEDGESVRAWVTACASGEEAYTLAICFAEAYRARGSDPPQIKIFSTDAADRPLTLARAGVFPGGIESDIAAELLERYFIKDEYTYRIKKHIREMVVFATHDVLRDPPFSRIDLCTCRNLLIYLEPETQRRAITLLHFALRSGGYLFLGNTESCAENGYFEVVSRRWRIFRKTGMGRNTFASVSSLASRPRVQEGAMPEGNSERPAGIVLLQRALLERYGPPTVVVDSADQIVYFHGATDLFLCQRAGEPTRDLLQLVRPTLRVLVQGLLRAAVRENRPMVSQIALPDAPGADSRLEITVAPVIPGRNPEYFLVCFRMLPMDDPASSRGSTTGLLPEETGVYEELRLVRGELQSTIEAYEATSEELKASNDEAMSVNEEWQSANEELKTSKEELQAMYEELGTVNNQLQAKILQLEATTNDLDNLLSSTNIAVLFLDRDLRVRRFTPRVTDLLRLIAADIGRPVTDIAPKFSDENLVEDARTVLSDLIPTERVVVSNTGRRYLQRTLPYRTADEQLAGVVVTFIDVQ